MSFLDDIREQLLPGLSEIRSTGQAGQSDALCFSVVEQTKHAPWYGERAIAISPSAAVSGVNRQRVLAAVMSILCAEEPAWLGGIVLIKFNSMAKETNDEQRPN